MAKLEQQVRLFTINELTKFALQQTLVDSGVENPEQYLAENDVEHLATYKANVLGIAILGTKPKARTEGV